MINAQEWLNSLNLSQEQVEEIEIIRFYWYGLDFTGIYSCLMYGKEFVEEYFGERKNHVDLNFVVSGEPRKLEGQLNLECFHNLKWLIIEEEAEEDGFTDCLSIDVSKNQQIILVENSHPRVKIITQVEKLKQETHSLKTQLAAQTQILTEEKTLTHYFQTQLLNAKLTILKQKSQSEVKIKNCLDKFLAEIEQLIHLQNYLPVNQHEILVINRQRITKLKEKLSSNFSEEEIQEIQQLKEEIAKTDLERRVEQSMEARILV